MRENMEILANAACWSVGSALVTFGTLFFGARIGLGVGGCFLLVAVLTSAHVIRFDREAKIDVQYGCKCTHCGKIYPEDKNNIPLFCTRCGADLVATRQPLNYTRDGEKTLDANMWGGYDYIETKLDNAEVVKICRRNSFCKWQEYLEHEDEEGER